VRASLHLNMRPPSKNNSISKTRCYQCKKKLKIFEIEAFKCKCAQRFCSKHLLQTEHKCSFDHKKFDKDTLQKQIGKKCISDKISKI
jgi:hypothetical protein